MKLLSISTDRKIFEKGSNVANRQVEYAKSCEETHIIIFSLAKSSAAFTETTLGSNIWVYPTRSSSRWMYIWDALRLAKFIVLRRGITNVTCQDPFETGLVGALIKKRHDVELEIQIHTDIGSPYFQKFSFLNRIRTKISKFVLVNADHVRVVSSRIKEYIKRFVEEDKIEIRPIVVDISGFKSAPITSNLKNEYKDFNKIILMVSRLEREKNIDGALRAFKIVLEKLPKVLLVIIGEGSQKTFLENLTKDLAIASSVVFLGFKKDLATYYKTCDCFLNTSWYEGYGMTLVEALASGAKIVSTDVGIAREVEARIVGFEAEKIADGLIGMLS